MSDYLPLELIQFQNNPHIKQVTRHEWSSGCPRCGGKDRFRMWETSSQGNARYWCRQCNVKGFVEEMSEEEMVKQKEINAQRRMEEEAARQEWIKKLQEEAYWQGWHDAMSSAARRLWERRGLPVPAQDWFMLGYTEKPPQGPYKPALTIPYHDQHDWGQVTNIQWRYLQAEKHKKYNQPKGQPLPYYVTDSTAPSKNLLIVEGAINAAVTWWELVAKDDLDYQVIGVPSSTPSASVMSSVSEIDADRVYIMTDPNTFETGEAVRVGSWFDEPLYVRLPDDPDDLLVHHGWTGANIDTYIRSATLHPQS